MEKTLSFLVPDNVSQLLKPVLITESGSTLDWVPFLVVWISTRKLAGIWKTEDPASFDSRDDQRMETNFQNLTRTGDEYMPVLYFNAKGELRVADGRQRLHLFVDMSHDTVPVAVPASQASRFEKRLGAYQESTPTTA